MDEPPLGTLLDRIPVTKVSPVIEGGAYPAKATVGEAVPIRATVFREGKFLSRSSGTVSATRITEGRTSG